MIRPTPRWAAAVGLTVALAISTPALASAQGSSHIGVNNRSGVAAIQHSVALKAAPSKVAPQATQAFPSATSTVISSSGFINGTQIGYFWSVSRGDSVEQTFSGPAKIKKVTLKLDVPTNALSTGNTCNWTVSINGTDVGTFQVVAGVTGPLTEKYSFPKMSGGSYDVKMRVTNEVPPGGGSHTLTYAGTDPHSIKFKK